MIRHFELSEASPRRRMVRADLQARVVGQDLVQIFQAAHSPHSAEAQERLGRVTSGTRTTHGVSVWEPEGPKGSNHLCMVKIAPCVTRGVQPTVTAMCNRPISITNRRLNLPNSFVGIRNEEILMQPRGDHVNPM